jgi:cell division transport system permease protein
MPQRNVQHRLITFWRIIKTGAQNFIRNLTLAIAAIAVMLITLTIILFSSIANTTFANTIQSLTDRIDISVYLTDDITENQRTVLIAQLEGIDNVKSVDYVSKEDALERYKQANQDNIDLLMAISQTDNPLPASLQVKPHDVNRIEEIREFLEQPNIKELQSEETSYSGDRKEAIDNIASATSFFRTAGVVGVIVFSIVSVLIIFNTIRMAIFNRRDELQIMRLLGASTWFIRGPFIVETVIYGIIAGLISVAIVETLLSAATYAFGGSTLVPLDLQFARNYFDNNFWWILTIQLALGILIGAASSMIATRRYLKFRTSK